MRYRWGFIDENDAFTECYPIIEDSTSIDYAQQSNEIFYRAKLNGELSFRFEFQEILDSGYNVEHKVVLQWYDTDNNDWMEIWRGRFSLTDCTIDYDSNTITVTPETIDRYTKIFDDWEKEYNIVKLAPAMQPVDILIRPLIQVYEILDTKISNYVGNNYWEADCTAVERNDIDNYKFGYQKQFISAIIEYDENAYSGTQYEYRAGKTIVYVGEVVYGGMPQESTRVYGQYWDGADWQTDTLRVRVAQFSETTQFIFFGYPDTAGADQYALFTAEYPAYGMGNVPTITINLASIVVDAKSQWDMVCARILCQTEDTTIEIEGTTYNLDDILANDMAGTNLNYNKVFFAPILEITISAEWSDEPTQWGKSYNDQYFVKPADVGTSRWIPVGQSLWKYLSVWYRISDSAGLDTINTELTAYRTIADSYRLDNVALKLFEKAGWNGSMWISRALNGNNDYVGNSSFIPCITAKSNVISSYYNSPAQNAPLSLAKIFTMLRQAYRIYWHIDDNGDIHVEHISYYENGYSYTETSPTVLVDLESELHTNTKEHKAYGQNKITFDKQDMPQQFTFGWADEQTIPFNGYPINCLDEYVNKGTQEDNNIGNFDTDVDYVLASPNNVAKDGFFLFLVPTHSGSTNWALEVESQRVFDIDGNPYDALIQNGDGAFVKIHKSWWRYDLPCERVNINNEDTTAITTGNFKVQSVEFADVSMKEILKNVDNCNLVLRTQQGDGHIKSLSINLNSLTAKADLVFNFIGRWYYLKGTALGASFTITINGESKTISVNNNSFIYRYKDAISALTFDGADVVSVNFADCDAFNILTSCDNMFKNCAELVAVDFGGKKMSAVLSATDMFDGCTSLTTLICPDTSTWKADLDFTDCPDLTTESLYDLIKFLYVYDSGVHTITPNTAMWNALDSDVQDDLIAKAAERGWTIGVAARYTISGHSNGSTVYATINGESVEIEVTAGAFQYDYNTAITSISFENDTNLTDIDFSLSDGLAGVTSLNDAFKGCTALTSVVFTDCDLSNVASASDCFANCSALTNLTIPSDSWMPDVDFSTCPLITYAEMQDIIGGIYTYTSGTHTITWNTTYWDSLTQPQQQTISDAADAKGWTTNSVVVVYVVRGKSSAATETFNIRYINDGAVNPSAAETVTCNVDANGDWEFSYRGKKIYSLEDFCGAKNNYATPNTSVKSVDFSDADDLTQCVSLLWAFGYTSIETITFTQRLDHVLIAGDSLHGGAFMSTKAQLIAPNATFESVVHIEKMFRQNTASAINLPSATFAAAAYQEVGGVGAFSGMPNCTTISMPNATFASLTDGSRMFHNCTSLTSVSMPSATFERLVNAGGMFESCTALLSIDLSHCNFQALEIVGDRVQNYFMFSGCTALQSVDFGANTFPNLKHAVAWFSACSSLTSVTWGAPTFNQLLTFDFAFANCTSLVNAPNFSAATFENVQDLRGTFRATKIVTLNMPLATFANVTNNLSATNYGDNHGTFYDCQQLATINMPLATFASVQRKRNMFYNNKALVTLIVPSSSTMPSTSAVVMERYIDLRYSPLTYASMLNVANWLTDLTGVTASTCTFKASAWNALSTAEQTNIDTILSGKNWNRAIA